MTEKVPPQNRRATGTPAKRVLHKVGHTSASTMPAKHITPPKCDKSTQLLITWYTGKGGRSTLCCGEVLRIVIRTRDNDG